MNIEVTRDNVTILEQSETPHENEYKITTCYFTFDEFTDSFQVKRAIFTILSTEEMYETDIINNQCDIPSEVLKHEYETVKLGVYGYNIGDNDELLNRFSPSYAEIIVPTGSYKEGALSPEPITPSQYDLYSQALQEGLQEVDDKLDEVVETVDSKLEEVDDKLEVVDGKIQDMDDALDDVDTAITETNNLNLDVSDKVDGDVTVTLTKKDASTKSVVISDGTSLMFNWDGTKLGVKTDEDSEYVYVDLQGIQGVPGPQGEPFRIKKTYSSVAEMNADFNNMEYGDYVMIASTVEIEDNAKLYTRGESQWIFITDFSGATGIKGETGATPNIQIGTVTSGSTPSVTRTGTNENPVLNFVLQPGEKGNKGDTGATGNGIASITKTSTSGLVDTYTITYTSGNTTTFNVTNGNGIDHISLTSQSGATKVYTIYFTDGNTTTFTVEDGEVTQEVFDEEVDRLKMVYNVMPKVSDEDTEFSLNNTAECPVYDFELSPSELEQATTTGKNLADITKIPNRTGQPTLTVANDTITIIDASNPAGYVSTGIKLSDLCPSLQIDDNVYLFYETTSTVANKNIIYLNSVSTTWTKGTSKTITAEMLNSVIALYGGYNETAVISNFMITKENDSTYEPFTYGPSPNPQYPQEIHTVSGENTVTIENKNLAKSDWASKFVTAVNDNTRAKLETKDGRNCLWYIPQAGYGFYPTMNFTLGTTFKENTQYTFSYDILKTGSTSRTVAFRYTDGTWTTNQNVTNLDTWYHQSVTSEANKTIAYICPYYTTGDTYIDINTWQIEEVTAETTYEEHKEQNLLLSLGDLEYCKIGDYEDEFRKSTGKNLFDKDTIVAGDIRGLSTSTRLSSRQNLWLKTGTYTFSTNLPNTFNYAIAIEDVGVPPLPSYPTYSFDSGWKTANGYTFTINQPGYLVVSCRKNDNSNLTINDISSYTFMLNEGTTSLSYEPYGTDKWYLKKNVGKVVLDGTQTLALKNWRPTQTSVGWAYSHVDTAIISGSSLASIVANKLKVATYADMYNGSVDNGICYGANTNYGLFIRTADTTLTTESLINSYLSSNPITAYYALATPTYTLLSDTLQTQLDNIHKAITYQEQTNVSQTNYDLPFVIKMSVIRDLSGIFELIQG